MIVVGAELVVVATPSGTGHVAHSYATHGEHDRLLFTFCGLHDDLEVNPGPVECRRCRTATADRLREEFEKVAQLTTELDRHDAVIGFLQGVLQIEGESSQ